MSQTGETFFTSVGCMDGRVQEPVAFYGKEKFGVEFPDTITEAGLVGLLSQENVSQSLLDSIKNKINISLKKHHSKGIIVHGHQDCAGNPVDDKVHKENVIRSIELIKSLVDSSIPIIGVFVKRSENDLSTWGIEKVSTY